MDNSVEVTENMAPSKVASRRPTDGSSDAFKTRSPISYNNYVSIEHEFAFHLSYKSLKEIKTVRTIIPMALLKERRQISIVEAVSEDCKIEFLFQ